MQGLSYIKLGAQPAAAHLRESILFFKPHQSTIISRGVARPFAMPGHWMGKPLNLTAYIHMPAHLHVDVDTTF